MNEQWRDVPGYEGRYQVSDCGRVYSIRRPKAKGKFLSLRPAQGYLSVYLFDASGKGKPWLVHRLVARAFLGLTDDEYCDHINLDKTDNRLSNLRIATRSQNQFNRPRYKNNRSGYKGVSYHRKGRCWQATIYLENKQIYLGSFDTPEEAHAAYCVAAIKYHGEFARFE